MNPQMEQVVKDIKAKCCCGAPDLFPDGECDQCKKDIQTYKLHQNNKIGNDIFSTFENLRSHMVQNNIMKCYRCKKCGKKLLNKNSLTKHTITHIRNTIRPKKYSNKENIEKRLQCGICDKSFKHKKKLHIHLERHLFKKSFQCTICKKFFAININLNIHYKKHFKIMKTKIKNKLLKDKLQQSTHLGGNCWSEITERPYECTTCSGSFKSRVNLRQHMHWHRKSRRHKCEFCYKSFKEKHDLKRHKRTHTGEKPHKCNLCRKAYTRKHYLIHHLIISHTHSEDTDCQCQICIKAVTEQQNQKLQHQVYVHPTKIKVEEPSDTEENSNPISSSKEPYKCQICSTLFNKKCALTEHLILHNQEKKLKCNICGKCFYRRFKLKAHIKTHTDTGEKPFQCNVCDKQFLVKRQLKVHLFTHTGEKRYKCELCDKVYTRIEKLRNHINESHTTKKILNTDHEESNLKEEKPVTLNINNYSLKCQLCPLAFANRSTLQTHFLTHGKKFSFECDFCGKGFYFKNRFETHRRTHTGEKPFKCDVCNKSFTGSDYLKRHMVSHMDKKLFKCKNCEKTYPRRVLLTAHIKMEHTNIITKVDISK